MKTIETHYLRYGNGMLTVFYDGPESQLEFTSAAESGNDLRLTDDEESSLIWLVNSYTAGWPLDLEDRPEVLWWDRFITYILRNVTIGSDEFRKSRAGLISADLMRYIREHSGLSPSDFREMSLADVFSEIQRLVEIKKAKQTEDADPDPFSVGRMKRRWLDENTGLTDKQFESIRRNNPDRVTDAGGAGRGPWKFRKSLCHDYGLNCPEFSESSP